MKHCIWLSRHVPTPAQRQSLPGYRIHQLSPPGRFFSATDALVMVENAARDAGGLDLIVIVLPFGMQRHFLQLTQQRGITAPVVRAIFDNRCCPPRFLGWKRLIDFVVVEEDWTAVNS